MLRAGSGGQFDLPTGSIYRPCTAWNGPTWSRQPGCSPADGGAGSTS
jgi:hypothetical protein